MYKKTLLLLIFILGSNWVYSSLPIRITLEELVKKTDHVFTGHVFDVDMIDGNGNQIHNTKARTGPGLKNQIRLIVKVEEVYTNGSKSIPSVLKIPLDSFMHFSFGQVKEAEKQTYGKKAIFLLSGKDFHPPVAGNFMRDLSFKNKIFKLKGLTGAPVKISSSKNIQKKKDSQSCNKKGFLFWQQVICK